MKMIFYILLLGWPLTASSLPSELRKNGELIQDVLAPVQVSLQESSAVFFNDEDSRPFLYGTVVGEGGFILTKASELDEVPNFHLRVGTKKYRSPQVISRNDTWDLALVKIEAKGLRKVEMGRLTGELAHGTWIVSNGAAERRFRRVRPGIISANRREIPGGSPAVFGVTLREEEEGLFIRSVTVESGADKAGLKEGDQVLKIAEVEVKGRDGFVEKLRGKSPGDRVALKVKRGEEVLDFQVELLARHKLYQEVLSRNDVLSGGWAHISPRRKGFPVVIQHETALTRRSVGGPVFTLEGVFVGMNIAAVNRVEVFAIPAEELVGVLGEMMPKIGP